MKFSVIIPTRNRPRLFKRALESVLAQIGVVVEPIVVIDGSDPVHADAYREVEALADPSGQFHRLIHVPRGHGQSYALNFGADRANGDYVCFLDDDDEWIDPTYLARVANVVARADEPVDLHLADQTAVLNGRPVERTIWIEDLGQRLSQSATPDVAGAYTVTPRELLTAHGFCHLNTTIVRLPFFRAIGGLDENIRYECDRDFYLRAIDQARLVKYSPVTVSRHHIPDPVQQSSMSTAISGLEKCIFQVRVLDRAIVFASSPAIRAHAKEHKAYALKRMAEELAALHRHESAWYYAREALLVGFGFKWLAFSALEWLRHRIGRTR